VEWKKLWAWACCPVVAFSVLDLSPIIQGKTAADALERSRELAQHAERLGFRRFWLAEHHNMPGIASAATAVVIGHIAAGTKTIRVGSGGIMLPNHAPLVIAEQFGTLESLFPGRIDLGLGRAPGSDQKTARALRRGRLDSADTFPQDVGELIAYFSPSVPGQAVQAVPGAGLSIPVWLLGSSLFSAQLAAMLGLPFAFASHFAPDLLQEALALYRGGYRPSPAHPRPYAMACVAVFAAATDEAAARLFSSLQQSFLNLRRGQPAPLPPPVEDIHAMGTPAELAGVASAFREAVVGSPATVRRGLASFIRRTAVDEVMVTAAIHDQTARLRSLELVAEAGRALGRE
jgi:luciferase family oxidoreductase group 1